MIANQYAYSRVNQLKTPDSYMYTTYEGPEFLSWYRQDRLAHGADLFEHWRATRDQCSTQERRRLRRLFARHHVVLSPSLMARVDAHLGAGQDMTSEAEGGERVGSANGRTPGEWIDTAGSLAAFLDALWTAPEESQASLRAQVDRYVARFEVTKKLYAAYSATFLYHREPDDDLGIYASFSLLLILFHERWGSLKFLNAALKVNDLLCSQPASTFLPFAALATAVSLDVEQRAVERLMVKKGIAHGA